MSTNRTPDHLLKPISDFTFESGARSYTYLGDGLFKLSYGPKKPPGAIELVREEDLLN